MMEIDVATRAERVALMADNHLGYVMPIGGVAAYRNQVSVVGVGFDIACVDAETEFLSPRGWVRMDRWVGGKVCQFDSPHAYRRLPDALAAQGDTIEVETVLRPLIVVMAGADEQGLK